MKKGFTIPTAKCSPLDEFVGDFLKQVRNTKEFKGLYKYAKERQEKIDSCLAPGKSPKKAFPELVVLRKWNSYTPLLPPSKEEFVSKGGGYFLRIEETGIVIDPGFNFIENFLRAGFKIDDIDHVFISHAHNDHTVELEGLFSLLFKRNKRAVKAKKDIKKIRLYMNLGAFKKFSGYFDLAETTAAAYIEDIILLNRHQHVNISPEISVFTTQAKHHEMITSNYALGFIFRFSFGENGTRIMRFTCDTGWNSEMEKKNKQQAEEFQMEKIDVLIAHIGSLADTELTYDSKAGLEAKKNEKALYEHHLGLIGAVASIHFWKPDLVLLSEFGEEMSDARIPVAEQLSEKLHVTVFPTDLNFRVNLKTMEIFCFQARNYFAPKDITMFSRARTLYPIANAPTLKPERTSLEDKLGKEITAF